ncbi:TIGR00366 family protein [Sedimentitalea sp. JM2-8]|uniref:TIGR00366 family protein n=1 Tax=Sedimentitalea xiamensis TaxID=3050037 RepID=A0ABT7FJZ5_9RHOB|nr:TIGR00366 family protein [Sedimentitalea xiamensis]MDK3075441.1 TIGR00366 family protein [Sedimentitalea xiamensis]
METRDEGFKMPHIYVILFVFTALSALATHFIPAGVFDRITLPNGRKAIDPESYREVAATPVGLEDFMMAVPRGLVDASVVVFFTFIIGGMFMVIRRTGVIDVAVDKLTRRFAARSVMILPLLMVTFAVVATLIGTQELALVYVPVILPLMIALRFDSITAVGVALLATTAGFTSGVLNPINTGLGQMIAEVPLYSGAGLRAALFVALLGSAVIYITRYALKVRANPDASLLAGTAREEEKRSLYQHGEVAEAMHFTPRQRWAGIAALAFFGVMVWGVLTRGWFMMEMAGLFVLMGITVGLIAGLSTAKICDAFNEGFRDVLVGAIIVGIARAVAVMLEQGQVMDTLVNGLGGLVGSFPDTLSAAGMFISQLGFNFIIPSGSGQALVTMPIMAPLSDIIGVTRQNAVLAYQLGDGLSNILYPTSGYFMATLALGGVSWDRWVRFFGPLFGLWVLIALGSVIFAQLTGWTG